MAASKKIETTPVKLYRLYEVASVLGCVPSKLVQWDKDNEIATPVAVFSVGGVDHWTEDSFPVWKELVDAESERIANVGYSLSEMTEKVKAMAERADRGATYARSRDRSGYSKSAVAQKIAAVEAIVGFLCSLSESGRLEPIETHHEVHKLILSAQKKLESK